MQQRSLGLAVLAASLVVAIPASSTTVVRLEHPDLVREANSIFWGRCLDAQPEWNDEQKKVLQQEWDGLCYSAAMRWITASKGSDWQVVHGTVFSGELDKRIEHAWCERDDLVVDLAMHPEVRVIDRHSYYRLIQPEVSKRYSVKEALFLSISTGHHGPWDESEELKE